MIDKENRTRQREKGKEHDMLNSKTQEADSVLTVSIMVRLLTFAQITNKHDSADLHNYSKDKNIDLVCLSLWIH